MVSLSPMEDNALEKGVKAAKSESSWSIMNDVLYDLCKQNPSHKDDHVILAKLVLIGRTYAAALERRRDPKEGADDFYINVAAPALRGSEIDERLKALPNVNRPTEDVLPTVVSTHKYLVDVFYQLTGQEKRSLASKYLHFHRPSLFFIFDSRAEAAARSWAPEIVRRKIVADVSDGAYHLFCERCLAIVERAKVVTGAALSPRELDNLLLATTEAPKDE